jgi:hypothetical protein
MSQQGAQRGGYRDNGSASLLDPFLRHAAALPYGVSSIMVSMTCFWFEVE